MPVLAEPVPPALAAVLRRCVLEHRARERRKVFAPVLHLGRPGAELTFGIRADEAVDQALRTDVVGAMLRRATPDGEVPPLAWLTRPGGHALHDVDAAWLPALRAAYAEAGVPLVLVVVTRDGWWDPRSGASRVWKRLRER